MGDLTKKEMVSYGLGNAGQNMAFMLVSTYLLIFYTDVFGITAAVAGTIFLVLRIFDAINDPLMGFIADRTKTRWGKFRPYLFFGTIPLAITTVLMFSTPPLSDGGKIIWAYVTYILQTICFTVVLIPWFSLPATMTQNPEERSKISVYSNIISTIAVLVVCCCTVPIVSMFPTPQIGYTVTAAIYMVILVVLFYICAKNTRERVEVVRETYRFHRIYKLIVQNKELLILSLGYIFFTIFYTLRTAGVTYYAKYNLKNENLTAVVLGCAAIFSLVGMIICLRLMTNIGKKNTYLYGMAGCFITNIVLFFIPYSQIMVIIILISLNSIFLALPMVSTWAMVPDTVDYGEWKTGIRAEGATSGMFSFSQKCASALGGALSGVILSVTGYQSNMEQTVTALFGISSILTIVPGVCCLACIVIMSYYHLTEDKVKNIVDELKNK